VADLFSLDAFAAVTPETPLQKSIAAIALANTICGFVNLAFASGYNWFHM